MKPLARPVAVCLASAVCVPAGLTAVLAASTPAQDGANRPRILGVAHVAFYVSDLPRTRTFYKDFLGFDEEPFTLKKRDGSERIVFIKVNDRQYLELFAEEPRAGERLRLSL